MNPEKRRDIVNGALRRKFGNPAQPTDEEKILLRAKSVTIFVSGRVEELLRALQTPSQYDEKATADLMTSLFIDAFKTWGKDELLYLCCVLHVSPMMEAVTEKVNMGLVGPDKDKPI